MNLQTILLIPILIIFGIILVLFICMIISANQIYTIISFMIFLVLVFPFYFFMEKLRLCIIKYELGTILFFKIFLIFTYVVYGVMFVVYFIYIIKYFIMET